MDDAYAIQARNLRSRVASGESYIGPKLGFTSKSKMEQMGVSDVIVGFLTAEMKHPADRPLSLAGLIHPRIEPELVFRLGQPVELRADDTPESLSLRIRESVDAVAVGMEVIDSRYRNFKFSLSDVVADNTSAAEFIVGEWQDFPRELRGLPVEFLINDEPVEGSTTDAILGDPFIVFDQLATMTLRYGFELPADAPILAGAMTAAHWLESGQRVETRVEGFPALSVTVA
ncbi:4-oxalocrotonate decarboxylase [Corynebacterium hylobatis]|uniref:4-oxalocrotonate decarboxylase n=1 Tax=Corynebacterium hylobatis TaxID=1859290 RepID=A0A430HWH1_9CORY|nr:4-oxalocrotonate decarboxylase [Corynebacterium hylobatis]RSZ61821.1 4-oxalocrotonate decarboxylase [Corynebacterium hylobatis]